MSKMVAILLLLIVSAFLSGCEMYTYSEVIIPPSNEQTGYVESSVQNSENNTSTEHVLDNGYEEQSSLSVLEESIKEDASSPKKSVFSSSEKQGESSSKAEATEGDAQKKGIMAKRNVHILKFNDTVADNTLAYAFVLPREYDSSKKYPILLYLHGVGVEGDDGERHLNLLSIMQNNASEYLDDAILLAPQCPQGRHWDIYSEGQDYAGTLSSVKRLVDKIASEYSCDSNRYYAVGYSFGGYGVLSLADKYNGYFAAVQIVAGWYNVASAQSFTDIPIWFHHGTVDNVVSVQNSKDLYDAIIKCGSTKAKISLYAGIAHNSYSTALRDKEIYSWMFSKTK